MWGSRQYFKCVWLTMFMRTCSGSYVCDTWQVWRLVLTYYPHNPLVQKRFYNPLYSCINEANYKMSQVVRHCQLMWTDFLIGQQISDLWPMRTIQNCWPIVISDDCWWCTVVLHLYSGRLSFISLIWIITILLCEWHADSCLLLILFLCLLGLHVDWILHIFCSFVQWCSC